MQCYQNYGSVLWVILCLWYLAGFGRLANLPSDIIKEPPAYIDHCLAVVVFRQLDCHYQGLDLFGLD